MSAEEPIGYVQAMRWSEWRAVCTEGGCGWVHSQGSRTQADAERTLRLHADSQHPPRIPVMRTSSGGAS